MSDICTSTQQYHAISLEDLPARPDNLRAFLHLAISRLVAGMLLPAVLISTLLLSEISDAHALDVIVNDSVAADALPESTVYAIFAMQMRRWPDGQPIKVFVLPDTNTTHASFSKEVLHSFPHQLRRIWDRLVFSGTGQAPIEVQSEEEMHRLVSRTSGAIGYVTAVDTQQQEKPLGVR